MQSNPSIEISVTTRGLSSLDKYIHDANVLNKKYFVVTGSLSECSHQVEGIMKSSYLCRDCFPLPLLSRLSPSAFMKKKIFLRTEPKFSSDANTAG